MRLLTYSLIVVVLIATIGLGWLFDVIYQHNQAPEQNLHQVNVVEQLGENIALALEQSSDRQAFIAQWPVRHGYQLSMVDLTSLSMPTPLVRQIRQQRSLVLTSDSQLQYYYLLNDQQVMQLSVPALYFQPENDSDRVFYTLLFYGLLIGVFILWAYPLLQQLNRLKQASDSFGRGELSQRIEVKKFSYIASIEQAFNHMAQRIDDLLGDVKLLSSAVSHDLRTPLARMRFGLDTLEEEDDETLKQQYLQKISANVDEMTELVEALLSFARLDQTMVQINRQALPICPVVRKCFSKLQSKGLKLTVLTQEESLAVLGDEIYISILINNLVNNAINYGEGEVIVELESQPNVVVIKVHDNGDGISAEQQISIFKPFVRGHHARYKGYGLGLAIVKRIVDWHEGSIEVADSSKLSGALFSLTLPAAKRMNRH